jgi:hypothetical protein
MKGFRISVVIIVLFLGTVCLGATKYVATTGNNSTGDGSIGNPWLTIQYAVSQIATGDTIKVGAGTYLETANNYLSLNRAITATIESQSGSNDVYITPSNTTSILRLPTAAGTYTLNNLTFIPAGATCAYLIYGSIANASLTLNNCVLDMDGKAGIMLFTGGTGETLKFNNCTIIADNCTTGYPTFYIVAFNAIEVNDCDITKSGGSLYIFGFSTSGTMLKIVDNTITSDAGVVNIGMGAITDTLGHLIVTGNIVTGCTSFVYIVDEIVSFAEICNNTVTSSAIGTVFNIGLDSGTGTNILSGFVVKNNTLTKTTTSGHCILLGTNCYGAEVSHNTFISTDADDYGIVIKGCYNNVHHNICKAANTMYISRGQYNKVQYNTCYAIGGYCFGWAVQDTVEPKKNVITNNIFDASGGGLYAMYDMNYDAHFDNYIDFNCYKAGLYGAVKLDDTIYNTLSALQSKWAAWSDVWPENDAHSIIADPQFFDAASDDFRLRPGSPCLNTGELTAGNGYTDIGAWQAIGRSELLPANCIALLEMDFNGDCKVDFQDLALFSLSWLECNLDPPEACWE